MVNARRLFTDCVEFLVSRRRRNYFFRAVELLINDLIQVIVLLVNDLIQIIMECSRGSSVTSSKSYTALFLFNFDGRKLVFFRVLPYMLQFIQLTVVVRLCVSHVDFPLGRSGEQSVLCHL